MGFRDTKFFLTTSAVVTRGLFVIYDLLLTWSLSTTFIKEPLWWLFTLSVVPLVTEMIIVIVCNGGREWNSVFSPSFLIFIACVTPQLWFIQIKHIGDTIKNSTENSSITLSATILNDNFTVTFSYNLLVLGLKESLMYLLIFARWVLPLQHLTYAQLSDTLFLYIGMAADLMELMDFSNNAKAMKDWNFVYALLSVWTLSLFQFTYVLVPTDNQDSKARQITCSCNAVNSEVLGMLLNLFMMYIPFAAIRVVAMVLYKGVSYSSVFFMVKNLAMILLSLNRLIALLCGSGSREREVSRTNEEQLEMGTLKIPATTSKANELVGHGEADQELEGIHNVAFVELERDDS